MPVVGHHHFQRPGDGPLSTRRRMRIEGSAMSPSGEDGMTAPVLEGTRH